MRYKIRTREEGDFILGECNGTDFVMFSNTLFTFSLMFSCQSANEWFCHEWKYIEFCCETCLYSIPSYNQMLFVVYHMFISLGHTIKQVTVGP